jgi:hypothetical protein
MATFLQFIPEDLAEKYEFINYNHAVEILANSFPDEWNEIIHALRNLHITKTDLKIAGGSESPIPPKLNAILDPLGWREIRISGDLLIQFYSRKGNRGRFSDEPYAQKTIENYIDGHNIDFVKGRVALDMEWNSKDQTFDRDLFAMRTYHECDIISVGVIITRSQTLNNTFKELGIAKKYGASTTWMGKLIPRLDSRRHGGCPILAVGITEACIED